MKEKNMSREAEVVEAGMRIRFARKEDLENIRIFIRDIYCCFDKFIYLF